MSTSEEVLKLLEQKDSLKDVIVTNNSSNMTPIYGANCLKKNETKKIVLDLQINLDKFLKILEEGQLDKVVNNGILVLTGVKK